MNKILEHIETIEDINEEWRNVTQAVEKAAFEVLGRKKKFRKKKGLKVWSTEIEETVGKMQET